MPSIEELLNSADTTEESYAFTTRDSDAYCQVDEEGRIINLNDQATILGVENDKEVERVFFMCDRYVGDNVDMDLNDCTVYINFMNANNEKDQYIVQDLNVSEDDNTKVTFSWLLSRKVTQYQGMVNFIICARNVATGGEILQEWNTTLARANVLEGLEPDPYIIPQDDLDVVNQLLDMVKQEIEGASSWLEDLYGVEVTDGTEPYGTKTAAWIDTSEDQETYNMPEIKDDTVSTEDTWSSQKIDESIESGIAGIRYIQGFVTFGGAFSSSDSSRAYTDYIPCGEGVTIKYKGETDHSNVSALTAYDEKLRVIGTNSNIGARDTEYTYVTPKGTRYVVLSVLNANEHYIKFESGSSNNSAHYASIGDINRVEQKADIYYNNLISGEFSGIVISENVQIGESTGEITVNANGYYYVLYYVPNITGNILIECECDSIDQSVSVFLANSETLASRIYYGNMTWDSEIEKYVCIIGCNDLVGYPYVIFGCDRRGLLYTTSISFKNVKVYSIISPDNRELNNAIKNKNYTENEIYSDVTQSGVAISEDGKITVSTGGYYFPSFDIGANIGDTLVRIYGINDNINISHSTYGTSGGDTPYITTETVDAGVQQAIISKEDWFDGYPYAIVRIDNRNGSSDIVIDNILVADMHISQISGDSTAGEKTLYVSEDGLDTNNGSKSNPLATVNKALENGASTVMVFGGEYVQNIDLSKRTCSNIQICAFEPTERVIFKPVEYILGTTESKEGGYTNVYKITVDVTFHENNRWIYQESVPDANTLISDEERHPLQRGYEYRCEDTKIIRCSSAILSEALTEIDTDEEYKWYYDVSTSTLYYSRPQAVTSENPICYSSGLSLFSGFSDTSSYISSLKVTGIESKYARFDLADIASIEILECKSSNVFGAGAFMYNRCKHAVFARCEAVRAQTGSNGDGFNAHSLSSGDVYSKQTNVMLIDCYSHDNNDDGYSDHERSETMIIGGLYEYNGKGGITPSYGSHCTCYNVYSRKNYSGFNYVGEVTEQEGGGDGQMICYGCVAENNTLGSPYAGFRVSEGANSMILVGCKSIGNTYGYIANIATNRATLIDCGSLNDGTIKSGSGTFTVKNTTIVS